MVLIVLIDLLFSDVFPEYDPKARYLVDVLQAI